MVKQTLVIMIYPFQEIHCFCDIEIQSPAADEKHSWLFELGKSFSGLGKGFSFYVDIFTPDRHPK